jgi:hypothetical protein
MHDRWRPSEEFEFVITGGVARAHNRAKSNIMPYRTKHLYVLDQVDGRNPLPRINGVDQLGKGKKNG